MDQDSMDIPEEDVISDPAPMPYSDAGREAREKLGRYWATAREFILMLMHAVFIALFINVFVAKAMVIDGPSMTPTLHYPQRVIVERFTYQFIREPERGDVVVIDMPGQSEPLIKRVVALPGERIEIVAGQVFVDGELLEEEWTTRETGTSYNALVVPDEQVFVLGDNRSNSRDSRTFGPIDITQIAGRAWLVYWPPEDIGPIR